MNKIEKDFNKMLDVIGEDINGATYQEELKRYREVRETMTYQEVINEINMTPCWG